jgi:hypothetical protein
MTDVVKIEKQIAVRTEYQAFHRYANAPDDVDFLREWHRHLFKVEARFTINGDRELEFFQIKKLLDQFIGEAYRDRRIDKSCECMAEEILSKFSPYCCEVSIYEDGENGSIVRATQA